MDICLTTIIQLQYERWQLVRILAIGLGGAGSRIVDTLHRHDRKSGLPCVEGIVVDIDPNLLRSLVSLPEEARMFFPLVGRARPERVVNAEEVLSQVMREDIAGIDAVLICVGLGGKMVDAAPALIHECRRSYSDPVFALAVLPCLEEGVCIQAKAGDDLEMLERLVDGVILFDNETWRARMSQPSSSQGLRGILPDQIASRILEPETPGGVYAELNENIARRISLLLRAGELDQQGIESAQTVLDAGEVLNTITGMGICAIGYAVEKLPDQQLTRFFKSNIIQKSKPVVIESDDQYKKASRVVDLAKRAVYKELSIPCDLTGAEKALVLVAGPSSAISLKGYQTVQRWMDQSIGGLEVRAGDYPISRSSYLGVIVILSGLSRIPRVEQVKEIRDRYRKECEKAHLQGDEP
jgi:cell division GTPase FtsZ